MDNKTLAALIDPSGATAFDVLARYWSVAQKNAQQIPLEGELLWNRLLWLGVGVVVTLARLSRVSHAGGRAARGRKRKTGATSRPPSAAARAGARCRARGSTAAPARTRACSPA